MSALDELKKIRVIDRTALDNAVIFSRHGEVEQAAAELAALRAQIAEQREALKPFAHPEFSRRLGGNEQGDESPLYGRNGVLLLLGDFKRAAAVLAKHGA
jgi:hypothetical protein